MPRLGVSMYGRYSARSTSATDANPRRVRYVNGVERGERQFRRFDPLFLKLAFGLAILATLTAAGALWRGLHR